MRSVLALAVAALVAGASAHNSSPKHAHLSLVKREGTASNSTSYLPAIIAASTTNCQAGCDDIAKVIAQCMATGGSDEEVVGRCSCGQTSLGVIRNCASCIVSDSTSTGGNIPMHQFNAFVNQCIAIGFANGTALATISGEQVSTASQITTIASSGKSSSMTPGKSGKASSTSAVTSVANNQNAASATTTAATSSQTSGAHKIAGISLLSALVAVAGAVLC
ncbi:hypothetical protein BCR35DRAFT_300971 [Leucosporidium creatinivorum]|uniref:Extracellular membrane protein CFEM domain-containing protein n=1 Tax=Leucosporidium creatinivorum TaxID=106004 RepID=A0A1Y2G0G4_9BASI|nr:hypothetical protein BCR35DRAFT_300971 [Leucosporidium creatinivorum]